MISSETPWIVVGPKRHVRTALVEVWQSRAVLYALVRRELSSRYRGSLFGFAWAIFKPLMQLLLFTLVIGKFLGASRSIQNYPIFIFSGLMVWGFLSECISGGSTAITSNAGLVTKVTFPREILPFARVLIAGFNFVIQIPVLMVGFFVLDCWPTAADMAEVLMFSFSAFLLGLSAALILGALNVYARDTQHLVEIALMVLIYISPIMYSWTFVWDAVTQKFGTDLFFKIYMVNPISAIVVGFQDTLWHGARTFADGTLAQHLVGPGTFTFWSLPLLGFAFVYSSYRVFLRLEPNFAREL